MAVGSRTVVTAEVFGDKHLIEVMEAWALRAGKALPAFEAIHEYLLQVEEDLFDSEGATGAHGAWEPIEQRSDSEEHPILDFTGALRKALTDAHDTHHRFLPTPFGFAFGTDLGYAQDHQTGTSKMPQRRVVDLTERNRLQILELISLWVTRGGFKVGGMPSHIGFRVRGSAGRFIS